MSLWLYIISAIITIVSCIPSETCNRVKIGDKWFDRKVLLTNLGRPSNLIVHKETNTLFFSYSLPETYSDLDFQLAYYDISNKDYQTIAGIKGGCAIAIDQDNNEVYLGGSDGIFKYNMLTKIADVYKEKGTNIWSLFHKRNLFFISYPNQKLYIEIDDKFSMVKEFEGFEVDHFYVTNRNEIYFANKTGLFKFDNAKMKPDLINELLTVRQLAEDNEEKLYICTNFGIFADVRLEGLKKVWDMRNIYGIAFDKDNHLIYSTENSIISLKFSKAGCKNGESTW